MKGSDLVTFAFAATLGAGITWLLTPRRKGKPAAVSPAEPPEAPRSPPSLVFSDSEIVETVELSIKTYDDFPKRGNTYVYAMGIFNQTNLRDIVMEAMAERVRKFEPDCIVAYEARGMMVGVYLATRLGVDFLPMRRIEHTPEASESTVIEDGYRSKESIVAIDTDIAIRDQDFVIADDIISSGSTVSAIVDILAKKNGRVKAVACITSLKGRPPIIAEGVAFVSMNE